VSNAPTAPSINDPFSGSVVTRLPPIALVVNNANDPDGDPISYIFELYADAQLATLLRTWREVPQGVNRTSVNIDVPLNENGRYYWRVRATDGPGYSAWTNIAYFTYSVINEAPGVPTTLEPTGQVRQNPNFVFQTSVDPEGDPISYEIKVFAPGDTFHSGAVGLIAIGNQDRITWTSPRPFDENTEYTWQVRATNNQIVASDWSPLSTFFYNSVNAPPTQPELLAPLEGAVLAENADLLFSATGSTDEDGDPITYVARISTDAGFLPESVVAQQDGLAVGPGNIVSWDLAPNRAVLDENTTYWWDIRAKDAEAYSPASAASFFVSFVDDPPGTPALQAPASEESLRTQTPTFAWVNTSDPEDEPLTYAIAVYRDANLTDIAWQKTEIPAVGGDGGLSTVIPEVGLSDNTSYFWRVRAVELDGGLGPWSEALRFTVALGGQPPTKPLLAGPANGAIFKPTDPVDLLWRPSTDPENDPITYRIEVLNQGGQLVTFKEGLTATAEINTYRLEIVLADGNYNWRIKAYSAGQESPWSNSALFTILTPIVDPNANNTNNTNNENNADNNGGNNGQDPDDEEPTDTGGAAKGEGCAQTTGTSGGSSALLALGLAWLWSRRRRR
jgi:MYXO-CTERM domain-containing protein